MSKKAVLKQNIADLEQRLLNAELLLEQSVARASELSKRVIVAERESTALTRTMKRKDSLIASQQLKIYDLENPPTPEEIAEYERERSFTQADEDAIPEYINEDDDDQSTAEG
jgi:hypothetical protein